MTTLNQSCLLCCNKHYVLTLTRSGHEYFLEGPFSNLGQITDHGIQLSCLRFPSVFSFLPIKPQATATVASFPVPSISSFTCRPTSPSSWGRKGIHINVGDFTEGAVGGGGAVCCLSVRQLAANSGIEKRTFYVRSFGPIGCIWWLSSKCSYLTTQAARLVVGLGTKRSPA